MTKYRDIGLYFISLLVTLLLFGFCAAFLTVSAQGVRESEEVFSITRQDPLHTRIEVMGGGMELDYTPLAEPERIRRDYAPLLTPRLLLTAEYAAEYASYWGGQLYEAFEEYLFARETYGADAVQVEARGDQALDKG